MDEGRRHGSIRLIGCVNYHWGCRQLYIEEEHFHSVFGDGHRGHFHPFEHMHGLWLNGDELRHVIFRAGWCSPFDEVSDEEYEADPVGCFHRSFSDVPQLFIAT